jgi:ribosome-binding protein aMBF1 (putative translation factor)
VAAVKQPAAGKPLISGKAAAPGKAKAAQEGTAKRPKSPSTGSAHRAVPRDNPGPNDILVIFGENLRAARMKRGLKQTDVADRTGLPQQYLSTIELGRQNVTLRTVEQLAEVVGQDVSTMLRKSRLIRNEK